MPNIISSEPINETAVRGSPRKITPANIEHMVDRVPYTDRVTTDIFPAA